MTNPGFHPVLPRRVDPGAGGFGGSPPQFPFGRGIPAQDPRVAGNLGGGGVAANPLERLRALLQARQVNPVFDLHPEAGASDPMAAIRAAAAGAALGHPGEPSTPPANFSTGPLEQLIDRIQARRDATGRLDNFANKLYGQHRQRSRTPLIPPHGLVQ